MALSVSNPFYNRVRDNITLDSISMPHKLKRLEIVGDQFFENSTSKFINYLFHYVVTESGCPFTLPPVVTESGYLFSLPPGIMFHKPYLITSIFFLALYFDETIGSDQELGPNVLSVNPKDTNHVYDTNVVYCDAKASMSIMCLFIERGPASGHPYQPPVNHRDLEFEALTSDHERLGVSHSALRDSLIAPSSSEVFDKVCHLSFFMYEIQADDGGKELVTHCDLSINQGHYRGRLKNRSAKPITAKGFRRALEVFGHKWCNHDGSLRESDDPPTLFEQAAFIGLFEGHNLSTRASFQHFLDSFSLGRLFSYDEASDVCCNARHLSEVLRCLQPVRFSVFEGQHREYICSLIAAGFYDISRNAILDPNKVAKEVLETVISKDRNLNKENPLSRCQLWRTMRIRIGFPVINATDEMQQNGVVRPASLIDNMADRDLSNACKIMRSYGEIVNQTSQKSVRFGVTCYLTSFKNKLTNLSENEKAALKPFTYENYLISGTTLREDFQERNSTVLTAVDDVISMQSDYKAYACGDQVRYIRGGNIS